MSPLRAVLNASSVWLHTTACGRALHDTILWGKKEYLSCIGMPTLHVAICMHVMINAEHDRGEEIRNVWWPQNHF